MNEEYGQLFFSNGNRSDSDRDRYGEQVQLLLDQIPQGAEVISVNHTQAGSYGQYWSTLIIWRVYNS